MKRDLYLAILSMDSYNRGCGRNIKFTIGESSANRTDFGAQIGKATVLNIDLPGGAKAAGFYALAYDVSHVEGFTDGETVIAYRGSEVAAVERRLSTHSTASRGSQPKLAIAVARLEWRAWSWRCREESGP